MCRMKRNTFQEKGIFEFYEILQVANTPWLLANSSLWMDHGVCEQEYAENDIGERGNGLIIGDFI